MRCLFDIPEESSAVICVPSGPQLLKHLKRAQSFGCRVFNPVLLMINPSLQFHCETQVVCVGDHVRLGLFDVGLSIVELVFTTKQSRKGAMSPRQLTVPVEAGCDSEGCLEMVDSFLPFSLRMIRIAKPVSICPTELLAKPGRAHRLIPATTPVAL